MKLYTAIFILGFLLFEGVNAQDLVSYKFDFGAASSKKGWIAISDTDLFDENKGYGFEEIQSLESVKRRKGKAFKNGFIQSEEPFYFSVSVPEGNYSVKVTFGDLKGSSENIVRAESRRLMVNKLTTYTREIISKQMMVNVRHPEISGIAKKVALKEREQDYLHWDRKLTLEFNGSLPKICAVEITQVDDAITVFLAGNSTVVDQANEPWAAWGQMFPFFFDPQQVSIANHAESGESLLAFKREGRLEKILSLMKAGDYLFIEFTHNDQKPGANFLEPFTTYKEELKHYIEQAKAKGGIPVLVTSMYRRNFDNEGKIVNTLGDYPDAMRQVAIEEKVALIDLNAMSKVLFEAMGPENSKKAFVHFPAGTFEGQSTDFADNTHFSTFGAYELANCVVEGLVNTELDLKYYLKADIPKFDPSKPRKFEDFYWPLSKKISSQKPDGN
ncbi:rhamnogalacturonan acetylesterase [Belliella sp. R4-6]|uniref:Rhamnogalacturonan acetylesterase n=1 Tax=Belliella alkalica TaxID=1730871 RepID=A0ABS9V9P3_9BACT|nr:rhamnogalacturonan acetylesterase [Belliella alkalica]MCH7413144.1 rhamnogalacturonan acetylesterase [Belliella alkalica]